MGAPNLRLLSLGAGVQSTALAILASRGDLSGLDGAIFSDTGWEPRSVYDHLDRLDREVLRTAGIPLYRVSSGNVRADALDPAHRFASMPMYVEGPCRTCDEVGEVSDFRFPPTANPKSKAVKRLARWSGTTQSLLLLGGVEPWTGKCPTCQGTGRELGIGRRQCTSEYKLKPIKMQQRLLLGARWYADRCKHTSLEWGCASCQGTGMVARVGQPPAGRLVEQWIGFSTDERERALDAKSAAYSRSRFPLLERDLSRTDCEIINAAAGFPDVAKSACIGCPYHRNHQWRNLKHNQPDEWADAVDFDRKIRGGVRPGQLPWDVDARTDVPSRVPRASGRGRRRPGHRRRTAGGTRRPVRRDVRVAGGCRDGRRRRGQRMLPVLLPRPRRSQRGRRRETGLARLVTDRVSGRQRPTRAAAASTGPRGGDLQAKATHDPRSGEVDLRPDTIPHTG